MERIKGYSDIEVLEASRQSYAELSRWWGEYIERLGGQEFVELVGRKNDEASREFMPKSPEDLKKLIAAFISVTYINTQGLINGGSTHYLTHARFLSDPDCFWIRSYPDRSSQDFMTPRSPAPANYPFYSLDARTGADVRTLKSLVIRHVARNPDQKLIRTIVKLDTDHKLVLTLTQLLKDGRLFPSPALSPWAVRHPYQSFAFDLGIVEPSYHINYPNNSHRGNVRFQIAEWAARRKSFIPHPGFYLPEAILKACKFELVVG